MIFMKYHLFFNKGYHHHPCLHQFESGHRGQHKVQFRWCQYSQCINTNETSRVDMRVLYDCFGFYFIILLSKDFISPPPTPPIVEGLFGTRLSVILDWSLLHFFLAAKHWIISYNFSLYCGLYHHAIQNSIYLLLNGNTFQDRIYEFLYIILSYEKYIFHPCVSHNARNTFLMTF